MLLYLGEPPVKCLWFCCQFWSSFCCCIFICWCSSFCCCSSLTFSFWRHLSPFRALSPSFYTHFILSAQPITEWFAILSFSTIPLSSFHKRYGLEWAFFTWHSFTDILTCVYQGFSGSRQFFLEVSRALYWSSKHRPGPSVCLIHSNPQTSYSERFSFKFYHIWSWIACGESLIYLLLTRFKLFSLVQSICKDY